MAEVDPRDDAVRRFVVRHYRYDPQRHQRRHVDVAAYTTEAEMRRHLDRLTGEIRARNAEESADTQEYASGTELEVGHIRKQANARNVARAVAHGVVPAHVPDGELPGSSFVLRFPGPER